MITAIPTRKLTTLLLGVFFYINTASAGIEPIPAGSFIINMGVVPQTYGNGLKPYGMIWTLIKYYKVPIKWVINPNKVKDGADFTYNGVDFKGGTFIIPKKFRSAKVDSTIANWQSQGVVGVTTTSDFNVDVTYTIKYNPLWTFDFQNGKIAQNYLTIAGIPITGYPMKDPNGLNSCDDLFVMPHADPTWGTHQSLLFWNKNNRGWLWYGCHAGSVIESTMNPADPSQQMDFLSTTGLVNFSDHNNPTPPYNYRFPADPEMQFMGTMDAAVTNGSEQVYLPLPGGGWRSSTNVAVYDPTNPDVPSLSGGEAAIVAYGRAFGDSSKGKVMFQAGHSFDKGNASAVAAIRAFFNFSYLSVLDKIVTPDINGPIGLTGTGAGKYPFTATLPQGYDPANYTFHWSSNTPGTFSNEFGSSTFFTPAGVASPSVTIIMVTITDGCGREYYQTVDFTVLPVAPVAIDRTYQTITNSPGTGAQAFAQMLPLAGTDSDGYVVNYIIKTLPASGVLYYDNDNNAATADVAISNIPAGGLVLTNKQMKSLKYDPVDNFGGNVSFQYTVQDNTNLYSDNTATYVIPVNPPPVAKNFICTPVVSNADMTPVCPLVATDNNTVVSYTIVSLPAAAKCKVYLYNVLVTEGQILSPAQASLLTYKPSGTYLGYAEIMYTATDNDGASDETPATITLQMINQAPVPQDISASLINNPVGNIQISIPALNAVDIDGTIASYLITNAPPATQGVLYYNNGGVYTKVTDNLVLTVSQASTLKFDPVDTYVGVAKFKYTATDNGKLTGPVPATFSIPVKAVTPNASNISNTSIYSGADLTAIKPLVAHDNDTTDIITAYIIKDLPSANMGVLNYNNNGTYVPCVSGLELTPAQGATLKFKPRAGFTGNAKFTYTAKDDEGLTDPTAATFTIPVTNSAPSVINIKSTTIADTSDIVTIKPLAATDADGNIAKFIIASLPDPSTGVLKLNGNLITAGQEISVADASNIQFQPVLHNSNDAVFKFTAVDDLGLADASAANYTIPINFITYKVAPQADSKTSPALTLSNRAKSIVALSGSDADGSVTTFQVTKLNRSSDGTLYIQGTPVTVNQFISADAADKLTFAPSGTFAGNTSFKYVAIDNDGFTSAEATITIPIVNSAPVANSFTANQVKTNTTTNLPGLDAVDSDGTVTSYKILSLPALGTLQYDSSGAGAWRTATVLKVLTPAQAAKIRIVAGGTSGNTSFTFSATDNLNNNSNTATYTIPVGSAAANQKPIVYDVTTAPMPINAGQTLISPLSGSDADGSILAYVIQSIPPSYHGTIYYDSVGYWSVLRGVLTISPLQAATLKFMPSGIYSGNVTFTFKAIDNLNEYSVNEATFTIPVTNTIAATNVTNASIPGNNGSTLLSSLSGTGVITKYIITQLPDAATGTLMLDGSAVSVNQEIPLRNANRLEFKPLIGFKGNATFKYTAADNLGNVGLTPATFTIPISDQLPIAHNKVSQVITNIIGTTAQDIPALTGTDNDGTINAFIIKTLPTGGKLYRNGTLISSLPAGGLSISVPQSAQLSFDPDDNYSGIASFTYTAKDDANNVSLPASYQILINQPPVTTNITTNAFYPGQPKTNIPALQGTDDGGVAFWTIVTLPSNGILYLNNVPVTDLSQVATLTATQVAQLSYMSLTRFDGDIFTYTATDNLGVVNVTPSVYSFPLSSFSTLGPLPVQLVSFTGAKADVNNLLKWSINQTSNNSYFDIERSSDGTSFKKIGTQNVSASSSITTEYSYTDKNLTATYYYRLKMVDNAGTAKYSNVVSIKRNSTASSAAIGSVTPNPFRDRISFDLTAKNDALAIIIISDASGKVVKKVYTKVAAGYNVVQINDLGKLVQGIYFIKINCEMNESISNIYKTY